MNIEYYSCETPGDFKLIFEDQCAFFGIATVSLNQIKKNKMVGGARSLKQP